ncbi:MAG: hypothetical protein PHT91_01125 [Candidatus Nanoarchaeia archaeon]|nr:hypothetical protein [Candidatus Nanoarchaeia archaeon]MDD5054042.1 hypothetical protein [Candidatus Nanoarchaeia archaeon]MDD5499460.1 hypothetical protein [Candidatus Nanoarchaeia archaeon]
MVKVIKKNKSMQPYKESKVVKSCFKAGTPEPIAKAIGKMVSLQLKGKKTVKSSDIKKKVLIIMSKVGTALKNFKKGFNKKKAGKKK